jgi:hypothetical protein
MATTPGFFTLMALFQRMNETKREYKIKTTDIQGNKYSRNSTDEKSYRLKEPIVVTNTNLIDICTRAEWYMVGTIMKEMYEYNALWACDPIRKRNSSDYRRTLAGLVRKEILFATEVRHMYLVNPVHLRRGDPFAVVATTANMLMNKRPVPDMLVDKKPVHTLQFEHQLLSTPVERPGKIRDNHPDNPPDNLQ